MTIITIETDRGSTKHDRRKYKMFPGGVVVGQSLKVIELGGTGDKGADKMFHRSEHLSKFDR